MYSYDLFLYTELNPYFVFVLSSGFFIHVVNSSEGGERRTFIILDTEAHAFPNRRPVKIYTLA